MSKHTYFFGHDMNAHDDEKILDLRIEHGFEGYGVYWLLVELLASSSGYTMDFNPKRIGFAYSASEEMIRSVIEDFGLFVVEDGCFMSKSLTERMSHLDAVKKKRAENGKLGGLAKAKSLANAKQMLEGAKANSGKCLANSSKGKERKGKEIKGKEHTNTPSGVGVCDSNDETCVWASTGKRRYKLKQSLVKPFFEFYEAYGFKKARPNAADAFANIPWTNDREQNRELIKKIVEAAKRMPAEHEEAKKRGCTPLYPATWINGQRWEDEGLIETTHQTKLQQEPTNWGSDRDPSDNDWESAI